MQRQQMIYFKFLIIFLFAINARGQAVYKTPSGEKYHLENCRMVKNVSQELTVEKAVEMGLKPCKICKPPITHSLDFKSTNEAKSESATVQCKGKTNAGNRCKHRTQIANGYCFQHDPAKK